MRNFFSNLMFKFQRFMYGRNGNDSLNTFLIITALILSLISSSKHFFLLYPISNLILIWAIFRFFSKNLAKRQSENAKFWDLKSKVTKEWSLIKIKWQDRKTHRYFKCPVCKKSLRVPKGRGKIEIRCPQCNHKFIKKT